MEKTQDLEQILIVEGADRMKIVIKGIGPREDFASEFRRQRSRHFQTCSDECGTFLSGFPDAFRRIFHKREPRERFLV